MTEAPSRHRLHALAILALAIVTSAGLQAQTSAIGTGSTASSMLAAPDRAFLMKAASDGLAEVELARLAQQQAGSDAVRQFAARMLQDHTASNEELAGIAAARGVPMPTTPDTAHLRTLEKLKHLSGAPFDREFMSHMVHDHNKDLALFQKQAGQGKDSDLKAFASRHVPVLEEHTRAAQSMQEAARTAAPNRSGTQ